MADFKIAHRLTAQFEGGYANDKADTGGETYAGVSRNNWPKWSGWRVIDQIKKDYGTSAQVINQKAKQDADLLTSVEEFYEVNFWNPLKLSHFLDQQVANTVFDFGVNAGTGRAAKTLQKILGLTQDGKIGPLTINEVNDNNGRTVHVAYNCERLAFYEGLVAKNQSQKKFLASWKSRLKSYV